MAPRAMAPAKGARFTTAAPVNSGASGVVVLEGCSGETPVGVSEVLSGGGTVVEVVQELVGAGGAGVSEVGGFVSV
ncbi:hypothetical protein BDV19DRAFT_367517 [Aspergillus venezuelensis]